MRDTKTVTGMFNTWYHIQHLKIEIEYLNDLIDPNIGGQGHIKTTINTLKYRLNELEQEERENE